MKKKLFKVVIKANNNFIVQEVKGYFTWISGLRVFIYHNLNDREWYVIDIETGMSFATGKSMFQAKFDAYNNITKLNEYKETKIYKSKIILYQKLLCAGV